MKSLQYRIAGATLAAAMTIIPLISHAEEGRPPMGAPGIQRMMKIEGQGSSTRGLMRDIRNENLEDKKMIREKFASSTMMYRDDMKMRMGTSSHMFGSTSPRMWNGSTTPRGEDRREFMKEIKDMKKEARTELRKELFEKVRENFIDQSTHAIDNLKQVRARIAARISTLEASSTVSVVEAKAKLVIADGKISIAEQALANLKLYVPPTATSTQTTSNPSVGIKEAREMGKDVVEAVKNAREALKDVVEALAHSMGRKLGDDNNSKNDN